MDWLVYLADCVGTWLLVAGRLPQMSNELASSVS